MKKMKHAFMAIGVVILTALFLVACGGGEDTPPPSGPTYELVIRENNNTGPVLTNATMVQGGSSKAIGRSLTASDDSSTAGITVMYACTTSGHTNCGVSVNTAGTSISVAATATAGEHSFTATAKKDGVDVATANFTVTVTLASYGIVFNPNNFSVEHNEDDPFPLNSTISAPNGNTTGLSLDFVCTTHPVNCGITYSGPTGGYYSIDVVPNTVELGEHSITATLNGTGLPTAPTAALTVRILPKYTLTTTQPSYTVTKGSTFDLTDGPKYSLTVSAGPQPDIGKSDDPESTKVRIIFGCETHYGNCKFFDDPNDEWENLTVQVADGNLETIGSSHNMCLRAFEHGGWGKMLIETNFVVNVED